MQVASNPAAGSAWPTPAAAPSPNAPVDSPVIGAAAASVAAQAVPSIADRMFMRQESHPAPSTPWGNADFAQSPSASLANVGLAAAASVHASEVGANNGALLMSSGALSALPIPPHMRQAMDAVYGLPPRQDGERNFSSGQDLPSGQQDPNDRDALPRQGAEPPLPPGKDGHPLRAKDPIRLPPGKDGTPLRVTGPAERPFSQRRGAPETPGAPENQAASPPVATAQTSAAAGIAPAHPVSQTSPSADPTEIAALELFLAEPANKELITHFGGALEPLPTWTTVGQGIEARYGSDLGGRLYQLQNAQRAVEGEFFKEMDRAKQTPPATVAPSTLRKDEATPESGKDGWVYKASGGIEGDPAKWVFDPGAFAKSYAAGDSPAQRGLANVHGGDPIRLVPAPDTEVGGADSWQMSGVTVRLGRRAEQAEGVTSGALLTKDGWVPSGLERRDFHLDPNRITKLINNEALWFDPVHGFTTDIDNLKPDALDKAMPIVVGAVMSVMSMGAASAAMGLGAASSCTAAGATAATFGQGAVLGAVGGMTNQLVNMMAGGKFSFKSVLISAVSGGVAASVTDLTGIGRMMGSPAASDRLLGYGGRAGLQGLLQQAGGGKFRDGFFNSAMASIAGEVTSSLDGHIAQLETTQNGLSAGESSMLRLFSRATGSALRIVGSGDPASGFASDFLGGILAENVQAREAGTAQEAAQHEGDPLGDFIAANEADWPGREAAPQPGTNANTGTTPTSITVARGDTLERLARQRYGENWRAGLTAMMAANPDITTNRWGSPIIQPGQTLETPSLAGLNNAQMARADQLGGRIVAGNTQGLNVRAELIAQQQAQQQAQQRAAAQAAAAQQTRTPGTTMSQDEAYSLYMASGGRSGSYQRAMGEDYKPVWHQGGQAINAPAANGDLSWGQRMNAEATSWNGLIDRLDEAAVADGGGPITAAAAAVRTPARSFLGFVQGAVGTATLADPAVRAQVSEGLGRLLDDPSVIPAAARRYYETHSLGEMAADAYVGTSSALIGNAGGAATLSRLNKLPILRADAGEWLATTRAAATPNKPVWVWGPDIPYRAGQSGAVNVEGYWINTVNKGQRIAFKDNGYLDPITNSFVAAPRGIRMDVDHILPVREIIDIPGFRNLTRQQMTDILQDRIGLRNLQPLPRSLNASKGARLANEWAAHRGQALNSDYLRALDKRQNEIRLMIDQHINSILISRK